MTERESPYIELYHQYEEKVRELIEHGQIGSGEWSRFARAVAELPFEEIHFASGVDAPIPNIPKDTPIVLGGVFREVCVEIRLRELRNAGFSNVTVDPNLTVSLFEEW